MARRASSEDSDKEQEQDPDDDDDDDDVQVGRKRKRASTKKAHEMAAIEASQSLVEKDLDELQKIGRTYGRLYIPFSALDIVMHWGAQAEAEEWNSLIEGYPNLRDLVHKMGKDFVVERCTIQLHRYRRDTRGEDVQRIKEEILKWRKWNPAFTVDEAQDKSLRGLQHPQMAELLLPRDHTGPAPKKFSTQVTPRLLYPDDDPNELNGPGLFKGSLVIQACRLYSRLRTVPDPSSLQGAQSLLLGPKAVLQAKRRPAAKSVTAIYNIGFVTFAFLAYVACLVRYALSSEGEYTPWGQNGFNYVRFHRYLLRLVAQIDDIGEAGQDITRGILDWCEDAIWGDDAGLDDDVEEAGPSDSAAVLEKYRQWIATQGQSQA
ncbi:hypothetical protein EXIGLDRAFT_700019 [Exidia glandulosa HHB12029]|uniref:Uncharacterized protein n=1 Tax=Exidia glandulosa HHB12029 TaxID=1314781 RepID=A0A165DM14_EXIGL|nr:hypothetical protein EXIGLDRAFT_700019 [Exidia glandulosa HHB12029]